MTFKVIGAGMAGLLAGAILRDECEQIIERSKELPNNHHSLLRFRSSVVGDALNIPFRKVNVVKSVVSYTGNPVGDAIAYSLKTNGSATMRSILSAEGEMEERYIAPPDLIQRMSKKVTVPIHYGADFSDSNEWKNDERTPIISTIPIHVLARILGYKEDLGVRAVEGWSIQAELKNTNLCATLYFPDPKIIACRASITDSRLIVEYAFPVDGRWPPDEGEKLMKSLESRPSMLRDQLYKILPHFGIEGSRMVAGVPVVRKQAFAKILPIDDSKRKRFILWATEKHNVYSLGRFATWRPGLLLDDLVQDLRIIQRIAKSDNYEGRK